MKYLITALLNAFEIALPKSREGKPMPVKDDQLKQQQSKTLHQIQLPNRELRKEVGLDSKKALRQEHFDSVVFSYEETVFLWR
jgi:hypothetical protein